MARGLIPLGLLWGILALAAPAAAQTPSEASPEDAPPRWSLSGDARLRLESDFDSRNPGGQLRDDRDRLRLRLRLAGGYRLSDRTALGARLRTGSRDSQQSAHVTLHDFDDNPTGDHHVLLDRWFVRHERERGWVWLGRNSFPFWKQNEVYWDDDVTPAGLAAGTTWKSARATWGLTGAYLATPDGGVDFHGEMLGAQGRVETAAGPAALTVASGLYLLDGEPGAELLRNGNGARDYRLWVTSLQVGDLSLGGRSLVLGVDLLRNIEDYSATDPDPFTARFRDETDGYVLSATWGDASRTDTVLGRWQFAYAYARVEALAVHASYAQDDWFRWGSGGQTDSSDFRGHQLRAAYALRPDLRLTLRAFTAEALTSVQDGNRVRLDLDYKF